MNGGKKIQINTSSREQFLLASRSNQPTKPPVTMHARQDQARFRQRKVAPRSQVRSTSIGQSHNLVAVSRVGRYKRRLATSDSRHRSTQNGRHDILVNKSPVQYSVCRNLDRDIFHLHDITRRCGASDDFIEHPT